MNSLSEMVKDLEDEKRRLDLFTKQYQATIELLYFAVKHDWVKDMINDEKLDLGIRGDCTKNQIKDYIAYIKKFDDRLQLNRIIQNLDSPQDKAFILSKFMN